MRFSSGIIGILVVATAGVQGFAPSSQFLESSRRTQQAARSFGVSASSSLSVAASAVNGASTTSSGTSTEDDGGQLFRLNVSEKARTVTSVCTSGTLCTVSGYDGIEGAPFGSYVDYVLDVDGNPVLLMNEMSMHTINIREKSLANTNGGTTGPSMVSLFTQLGGAGAGDRQDVSRCSITGTIEKIDPDTAEDMDMIRMKYSITHTYADQVMDSPKFDFYRIIPNKVYFVGGFGVMAKWVPVEEYMTAGPDILAKEAPTIVSRINRDHGDDLLLTAKELLQVEAVEGIRVTNVDRLGMDIRVTKRAKRRNKLITDEFRVGFRVAVISVEDAKSEILKVFQEAWEKANGVVWETDDELPGTNVPIFKIAEDGLE
jgi:putative heme iron utilization protein